MGYRPPTEEQLELWVEDTIHDAIDSLDAEVPNELFVRLVDTIEEWEGWDDYVLDSHFDGYLDNVESLMVEVEADGH